MTILIVEDNPRFSLLVKNLLLREIPDIRQIYECDDGAEAIEMYKQHRPDWTLMDIGLKTIDGLTAARTIRSHDNSSRIVILTQHNEDVYKTASEEIGVRGYVEKDQLREVAGIIRRN